METEVILKVGDTVDTIAENQRKPVSYGDITYISECKRYASVKKVYGRKKWTTQCKMNELKLIVAA